VQTAGTTRLNGGSLDAILPLQINGGTLDGSGSVDASVRSDAEVSPGLSPGTLSSRGDFTQGNAGQLTVQLGGSTPTTSTSSRSPVRSRSTARSTSA